MDALDASPTAIAHLRQVAQAEGLRIQADEADLRSHAVRESYDAIACIGLLMFFDCPISHGTNFASVSRGGRFCAGEEADFAARAGRSSRS